MSKVPVIDFSKQDLLQPGSPEWNSVRVRVRRALEDYGSFKASMDRLLELRKALCVSESRFHGYMGTAPPSKLHEKKAMRQREMEWFPSVSNHIVELIPTWQA
ncbi:hypothetical protein GQ457_17G003610 [Hibiscus cannabinus]